MVRFDTSTENSSSPEMLSLLEDGVTAAIRLDKQVSESWCNIDQQTRGADQKNPLVPSFT